MSLLRMVRLTTEELELEEKLSIFCRIAENFFFSTQDDSQRSMPKTRVVVRPLRVDSYSAHSLDMNGGDWLSQVVINSKHIKLSFWELAEVVMHELVLIYQEVILGHPFKGGYHNGEFIHICEDIGLHPKLGEGYHLRPADGQFTALMSWLGEEKPQKAYAVGAQGHVTEPGVRYWFEVGGNLPVGKSALYKYISQECTRQTRSCILRSGSTNLDISCNTCGGRFQPIIN